MACTEAVSPCVPNKPTLVRAAEPACVCLGLTRQSLLVMTPANLLLCGSQARVSRNCRWNLLGYGVSGQGQHLGQPSVTSEAL